MLLFFVFDLTIFDFNMFANFVLMLSKNELSPFVKSDVRFCEHFVPLNDDLP